MKLKEKEKLVQEIGMKFDEAVELFSDETLESMSMVNVLGGADAENTYCGDNEYCCTAQCFKGCQNHCSKGCGATVATPTKPVTPVTPSKP